jgi:hypothetical protein
MGAFIESIKTTHVMDTELDMQRMVQPEVRTLTALLTDAIIWLQQDHWVFKHPRRSIDLDHQKFTPNLYRTL